MTVNEVTWAFWHTFVYLTVQAQ